MKIKAILFDINGTITDIKTDEGKPEIYSEMSKFLFYHNISIQDDELKEFYFHDLYEQLKKDEKHPEFSAELIFKNLLAKYGNYNETLPGFLSVMYRALSLIRIRLYDHAAELLENLSKKYTLAAVTDGQSEYATGEMKMLGIDKYFKSIVISGNFGYRKPDERMFRQAMNEIDADPSECLYIGNDIYADIYGAQNVGIKSIMYYSNQGQHHMENVTPDYAISSLYDVYKAIEFLENQ